MLSLILAAFMGALLGAFVYQCLSLLLRHARRPPLEFEIRSEGPFVVAAMHNEASAAQATWIRVRIYNSGRRSAKSCRLYLMGLGVRALHFGGHRFNYVNALQQRNRQHQRKLAEQRRITERRQQLIVSFAGSTAATDL
jgi:hypothetical protein